MLTRVWIKISFDFIDPLHQHFIVSPPTSQCPRWRGKTDKRAGIRRCLFISNLLTDIKKPNNQTCSLIKVLKAQWREASLTQIGIIERNNLLRYKLKSGKEYKCLILGLDPCFTSDLCYQWACGSSGWNLKTRFAERRKVAWRKMWK